MSGTDIAIDLGTSSVKIYLDKKGIVLNEPSVIAVDTVTDSIVAVGTDAYKMIGNAVPVNLAYEIAIAIKKALS